MSTLAVNITNIQSQLDSVGVPVPYWSTAELRAWVNDGVRDIARRTETILEFNSSLNAVVGQAKYNLPTDVIRMHRIEFVQKNSTQVYPIQLSTYDELDQMWGINQSIQGSYPAVAACWGPPGSMTVQFYPVPAQAGVFNLFYYAMPVNLNTDGTDDTTQLNIPYGWDDLVVEYVTYRAMMKMKAQDWQQHKQLYDQTLQYLVDVTREAHDQGRYIQTRNAAVPMWLYSMDE